MNASQRDRFSALDLAHADGEALGPQVVADELAHAPEQGVGSRRPDELDGLLAGRQRAVAPGIEQRGHVEDVVGMKVRQHEVRDAEPVHADGGHAMHDSAPAVEQDARVARVEQVAGIDASGGRRGRAGPERRQAHQRSRTTILRVACSPSATSRAR